MAKYNLRIVSLCQSVYGLVEKTKEAWLWQKSSCKQIFPLQERYYYELRLPVRLNIG